MTVRNSRASPLPALRKTRSIKVPRARRWFRCRAVFAASMYSIERDFPLGEATELPVRLRDNDLPADFGSFSPPTCTYT